MKREVVEVCPHCGETICLCDECIFYTPNPDDALMGKCSYKNRDEVVFDDDYCSRGERK